MKRFIYVLQVCRRMVFVFMQERVWVVKKVIFATAAIQQFY